MAKAVRLAPADQNSATLQLLDLEAQAREARSTGDLALMIANATRKLTRARQIFVLATPGNTAPVVLAVTGLATVDRNTPLIQWLERTLTRLAAETSLAEVREFMLQAYSAPDEDSAKTYPFRQALWLPLLRRDGALRGGVLLVRETPWLDYDQVLARRLSATFSHAWSALAGDDRRRRLIAIDRRTAMLCAAIVMALGIIPVPMSTLAPFEIAARDGFVVSAPIDGVIEDILVPANSTVAAGEPLVQFVATTSSNRVAVAERETRVAEARVKQAMLDAFKDTRGRYEAGILRAELAVKSAELTHARDMLARTRIGAAKPGIAVFGDKRDLIGRPVSIGERLMEIADPGKIELRIDVPVGDSIILATGARVKAFLDSEPLSPRAATVVRADYQAKQRDGGILAFRVVAELDDAGVGIPRLGVRGTAQLFGRSVPLAYYLFRRPITRLRQWTGL